MSESIAPRVSETPIRTNSCRQPQSRQSVTDSEPTPTSQTTNDSCSTTDVSQQYSVPRSRRSRFCVALVGFANKLRETGVQAGSFDHGHSRYRRYRRHRRHRRHGWNSSSHDSSTSASDPSLCELPWGGKVKCFGYLGETHILLPPFSQVVGFSTSVDTLDMSGTCVVRIPYDREIVNIDGEEFVNVTHLAFRNSQTVPLSRCIARRVVMVDGNSTHNQICESGPVVKSECTIAERQRVHDNHGIDMYVIITSPEHRVVEKEELSNGTLHAIPTTYSADQLDQVLLPIDTYTTTLKITSPFLSIAIFILGAILWMFPGFLEWVGNEDCNWAIFTNQCIGTGSVLLGVIMYFSRKFFAHDGIRAAAKGVLYIRNDFAAKLCNPRWVSKLRPLACHPLLPSRLIAKDENGCVRVKRDGWVRVGNRIPVKDAGKHGYYVLRAKGLVLDLYDARLYKLLRAKDGNVRILRAHDNQGGWTYHSVSETAMFV